MANTTSGRFAWRELVTQNPKAAIKFYTELFGWTPTEMDMGAMGKYTVMKVGGREVAGFMEAKQPGPSMWLVYVTAENVDATVAKARELGAQIVVPGTDIPNVGRFGILKDPQGAAVATFTPAPRPAQEPPKGPGTFCWDELHTTDCAAAAKFYESMFGWTHKAGKAGEHEYWEWKAGDQFIGGMMQIHGAEYPPMWLSYVEVANVDPSNQRAIGLGAKSLVEPRDIPKVGRFSVLADPTGAMFALFKPSPEMAGHKS
jgi:predicted enzyme related to lactoylglutathione lyase